MRTFSGLHKRQINKKYYSDYDTLPLPAVGPPKNVTRGASDKGSDDNDEDDGAKNTLARVLSDNAVP